MSGKPLQQQIAHRDCPVLPPSFGLSTRKVKNRASTCETLSLPVLLTYNETIPIPGSDSQNESLAFLGSDSLNGSVAFLGSQIDNGSLPEPGSEAFDEFLTESLSGVDADNEGFPVPESNVTREVERAFGGDRFYTIRHALGFTTLCDTQADGGGWTVVQGNHEVRFEFTTSSRQSKVVQYNRFSIGPDWDKYRLLINALDYNRAKSSESGFSIELHNLMRFTTVDRDNDVCLLCNCAFPGRGGWWHYSCATANLNGLWGMPLFNLGPSWIFNAGLNRPLRSTAMMIRLRV
ncbi:hypothetical protein RRG08_064386 [Elysia crispata]|uniref:Fibrinogen C-terminal domain-containing protein n=1 Tax=Elysia crispata TaxID=231223 RepID=A0AAE0YGP9_9GAST|nr:hypothetical protein RRG08_064386 [Elysia crispata]